MVDRDCELSFNREDVQERVWNHVTCILLGWFWVTEPDVLLLCKLFRSTVNWAYEVSVEVRKTFLICHKNASSTLLDSILVPQPNESSLGHLFYWSIDWGCLASTDIEQVGKLVWCRLSISLDWLSAIQIDVLLLQALYCCSQDSECVSSANTSGVDEMRWNHTVHLTSLILSASARLFAPSSPILLELRSSVWSV